MNHSWNISFTYLAILSWMYFILSALVIKTRLKYRVSIGGNNISELEKLIRVHGNFAEYIFLGITLIFAGETLAAPTIYLHSMGLALIIGRVLHFIGVCYLRSPNPARVLGMTLTFYVLITAPAFIIYQLYLD
jgi:uncharacterized membrane protein YecN with MAPEG domain